MAKLPSRIGDRALYLPPEAAVTPAADIPRLSMALKAPRALNEPLGWSHCAKSRRC
jgi:hypothetical protein